MKSRLFSIFFVAAIAIQTPAQTAGPSQSLLDDLGAAAARAEQSRTMAGDFEAQSYFPSEWEAAEEQFAQAGRLPKGNDAEARSAIAAFNAAAASFDSVFALTIPLYAQGREDEIMMIRGDLVDRGAKVAFPEYFAPADQTALLAFDQHATKDYYPARDSAAKALEMYQILAIVWDAWNIRREITERGFGLYDPDNYERAGEILSDAADAYKAENLPPARESAEEALLRYRLVLSTAWAEYAEFRSSLAENERQAALTMKSNIASREFFLRADSENKAAQRLFLAEEYEEAAKLFTNSEAMFVIASMATLEKQRIATTALREALSKIEESSRTVRQAEIAIEGGTQ